MKIWEELSRIQKILLGILIGTILISIPESVFLIDVGGVDLVLFFLVMYSQNIKVWVDLHFGMIKYPMIETKIYVKSMSLSSVLFVITSSFVFSSGFFLLLMFLMKG
jgi:hypothetical protein